MGSNDHGWARRKLWLAAALVGVGVGSGAGAGCLAGPDWDLDAREGAGYGAGSGSGSGYSSCSVSGSCGGNDDAEDDTTTGDECPPPEPDETCCLAPCESTPHPLPPGTGTLDCPVADMPYNCCVPGTDLFDCDDFAYACEQWGRNQGLNICQYVYWYDRPDGTQGGHAINIVEVDYPGPNEKYCFVEPQTGAILNCWIQEPGPPDPPGFARDELCSPNECTDYEVSCDDGHFDQPGEICFQAHPAVCSRFREETGLCPYTFDPVYDCSAPDPDDPGTNCHWDCEDDEMCGDDCGECIGSGGGTGSGSGSGSGSASGSG